jgi:hypothetical protein
MNESDVEIARLEAVSGVIEDSVPLFCDAMLLVV